MRAIRTLVRLADLTVRAAVIVARLIGLYFTLYLKLKVWRVYSKLKFRVKVRRLPRGLARDLAREYDEAVSQLGIPGPIKLARNTFRRHRGSSGGG